MSAGERKRAMARGRAKARQRRQNPSSRIVEADKRFYACGRKRRYVTLVEAQTAAAALTRYEGREVAAFPCPYCHGFHAGKKATQQEQL